MQVEGVGLKTGYVTPRSSSRVPSVCVVIYRSMLVAKSNDDDDDDADNRTIIAHKREECREREHISRQLNLITSH